MKIQSFSLIMLILTLKIIILGSIFLLHPTSKDQKAYEMILQKRKEIVHRIPVKSQMVHQYREDVLKDIWFNDKMQRLHLRIHCDHSELTISHKASKIEFLEDLKDLQCWIQDLITEKTENSSNPMQHIRYFTSKRGLYAFPSHRFSADHISLSFFHIEGKEIPFMLSLKEAYLHGFADEISMHLENQIPYLEASHFKAQLNPSYDRL